MKPNNLNTATEHRFFYPDDGAVEYHESLDADHLPNTILVGGRDNYAVFETTDGDEEAIDLAWTSTRIPARATILGIRSLSGETDWRSPVLAYVSGDELIRYLADDTGSYDPHAEPGTLAIVQRHSNPRDRDTLDPRFTDQGIAILPVDEPLPILVDPQSKHADEEGYSLLGFITPSDKLVTWTGPTGYTALLVDWSVANAVKQNNLETALLYSALPTGSNLLGLLDTRHAASTYLRYYDARHGTSFMPTDDPRYDGGPNTAPQLTDTEYALYRTLTALASGRSIS